MEGKTETLLMNPPQNQFIALPIGLETLYAACRRIYPAQPNPLQVTALVKYWLGGPDPLDYISMYANPGDVKKNILPHWHYISFGLSDLHGDGRVHMPSGTNAMSGFGFELCFRLIREPKEISPPTWPAAVMQALAKYVFQSENILYPGDHVSWHCPLDNSESRIQHMLMMEDPQLGTIDTPHGQVTFIQIVGVCAEELQASQHWNGPGLIELMKGVPRAGGPWLVTDMRRGETIFELDPQVQEALDRGIENEGSNLSGVSARCVWTKVDPSALSQRLDLNLAGPSDSDRVSLPQRISVLESEQIKAVLKKGLMNTKPVLPPITSSKAYPEISVNQHISRKESYDSNASSDTGTLDASELITTKYLDAIHLTLNYEAGTLLPLVLRGRLKHGRHFTYNSVIKDMAITFVASTVVGAFAQIDHPYAAHGQWLQVLLTNDKINTMMEDLEVLISPSDVTFPATFSWPEMKLAITILPDDM